MKESFFLSEENAEWISQKKSEYLSELIQDLSTDDFSFEEFHHFDNLIPNTLERPDQIYRFFEGDYELNTFIKAYKYETLFNQIIIAVLISDQFGQSVVVPILIFVTKKNNVISKWSKGTKMINNFKN